MTRNFCDCCGKEVVDEGRQIKLAVNAGGGLSLDNEEYLFCQGCGITMRNKLLANVQQGQVLAMIGLNITEPRQVIEHTRWHRSSDELPKEGERVFGITNADSDCEGGVFVDRITVVTWTANDGWRVEGHPEYGAVSAYYWSRMPKETIRML